MVRTNVSEAAKGPKRSSKQLKKKQPQVELKEGQKPYINAYKRAEFAYQKIQEERKAKAEAKKQDHEKKEKKFEEYLSLKKKMNKALKKKTKRGQPKLGAQMDILLQKIERKLEEERG